VVNDHAEAPLVKNFGAGRGFPCCTATRLLSGCARRYMRMARRWRRRRSWPMPPASRLTRSGTSSTCASGMWT